MALRYSFAGLKAALEGEAMFRQKAALFIILAPLGAWLGKSRAERALLVGSLFIVLIAELINSAIEAAVDRAGTEPNPLAKRAKDIASAAVFVALVNVIMVWLLILVEIKFVNS
ncbi:MAG: diacylglycerol kinase [Pseudomonadota bacterium]